MKINQTKLLFIRLIRIPKERKNRVGSVSCIEPCMIRRYGKESYHVIYNGALAVRCGDLYTSFAGTGCGQEKAHIVTRRSTAA